MYQTIGKQRVKRNMPLQISDRVRELGRQAQADLGEQFARIDAIAEENTQKVLAAFQKHRVAEAYFALFRGARLPRRAPFNVLYDLDNRVNMIWHDYIGIYPQIRQMFI